MLDERKRMDIRALNAIRDKNNPKQKSDERNSQQKKQPRFSSMDRFTIDAAAAAALGLIPQVQENAGPFLNMHPSFAMHRGPVGNYDQETIGKHKKTLFFKYNLRLKKTHRKF